ncbi:MAG TPA: AMP-binding protein [Bryobacteraceae bacterium]|nr:AMP-binding protein [Bryobacteraceae bacterium]
MQQAVGMAERLTVIGNVARLELENIERFGVYTRLYYEDQSYTNAQELRNAGALARLLHHYGVRRGDRVVAMLPNSPELTSAFQAIWTIGAAIIPVIPQWTAGEVGHILRNAEPEVAITIPALAPRLEQANAEIKTLKHLLVFGDSEVAAAENILDALQSASPIENPADVVPSDLAVLLYTSGTTGTPKGVMLTHENVSAGLESTYQQNPNLARGSVLNALPLTHVFGILVQNIANRWGWSTVLMRQFDPVKALEAIERHKVTYLPGVPTMLMYLLGHPERAKHDLSSLTRITSGGAALPERLRQQCEQVFRCRVDQGYGLTESASVATGYEVERPYRAGSVGVATPGVEICILSDRNELLPAGSKGEICLKGGNIMAGYWRDPAATNEVLKEGWLHTGDIGYLDQEGYLFITDRKKDLIIKGGENISPREIEEALYLHPAVAEAAVIGVPDAVYGEEIWAVLQLKTGVQAAEEEVRLHVSQYVTKFKVPSRVLFQPMLPKNLTGKILKYKIRAQLLAEMGFVS